MAKSKWREQYDRMKQWRARLDESVQSDERRRDDFYAFFVCCYHLVDWVENDDSLTDVVRAGVRQFVKDSDALGLAADVTNGFKHLKRKQTPQFDATAHVSVIGDFTLDASQLDVSRLAGFVIAGGQTWEDAYALADRCIKEWEGFLRRHGLM